MRTTAIIEARLGSSRLPGKVLLPVLAKPILQLLIERLKAAASLDQIVVATTSKESDQPIADLCASLNIGCFRGSEDDVLDRVLKAAEAFDTDLIVEITADCPLIDPRTVDLLVNAYKKNDFDFIANRISTPPTYPDGLGLRLFSTNVLKRVDSLTKDPTDREHVSLYIWEHPDLFSLHNIKSNLPEKHWSHRLTLDTKEDFEVIKKIFEGLYPKNPTFSLEEILEFIEQNPDLLEINRHVPEKPVR